MCRLHVIELVHAGARGLHQDEEHSRSAANPGDARNSGRSGGRLPHRSLPGVLRADSGLPVSSTVATPEEAARLFTVHAQMHGKGVILAQALGAALRTGE